jgi:hypothetical protein
VNRRNLESRGILRSCLRRKCPRNAVARLAASYSVAAAMSLRCRDYKQNRNPMSCSEMSRANSSNLSSARSDSSSSRSVHRFRKCRPHCYARAPRTGSSRCWRSRYGRVRLAAAPKTIARVGCSGDAHCWVESSCAYHYRFHTDWQKSSLCLPRHCSLRSPQGFRRSAFRFRHSSRHEIRCHSRCVLRLTRAKPGSAASIAADARPAAGTIAGVTCFACPQNAVRRCCESWMEPRPVRWPTNWRALARRVNYQSSFERNLAERAKPLRRWYDLYRNAPHSPSIPLVRCADR